MAVFEASDPVTVREVNDAVGLPYRRVVEALDLLLDADAHVAEKAWPLVR
jgi:hypothetical protein